MKEPLLDAFATERAGAPRELLTDMTAAPPATAPAHRISPEAWAMLRDGTRRGLKAGRSPEGRLLRDAGLLNAVGSLTPRGQQLVGGLGPSALRTTVRWESPGAAGSWSCWITGGSTVVEVRTAPDPAALAAAPHALETLTTSIAVARLLDRLEIGPVWTFGDEEPIAVPDALVGDRIRDPGAPLPEGAGPLLKRAWRSEPWTAHLITRETGDAEARELRVLRTGTAGWLRSEPVDDDASLLLPEAPADLVRRLLALLLEPGARS